MKTVTVNELHRFLLAGARCLVLDVRTPVEYAESHVSQALSAPLDSLDPAALGLPPPPVAREPVYLLCRSGQRATRAAERFAEAGYQNAVIVQGGTLAWIQAGLPVWRAPGRVLGLDRQVRIGAGLLVLAGIALGRWVDESCFGLAALVGAGMVFSGVTDRCGLALLLSRAPLEPQEPGMNPLPVSRNGPEAPPVPPNRAASSRRDPRPEAGGTPVVQPQDEAVRALLASYRRTGGLNNTDSHNMPSKRAVGEICEGLLQLLFPGFHDDDAVIDETLEQLTASRLALLLPRLEDQVRKSVRIGDPRKPTGRTPPIMRAFCAALPEVRELLRTDIESAYASDPAAMNREEIILSYPFIEAISIQRLAHLLYREGAPVVPRMMTEWAHGRTGIDIHPGACIGESFFIDHGTGTVIGETCRICRNVKIYHGVTLGARSFPKDASGQVIKGQKRHPDVEDNVTIYPNSTILGGDTVIGANSTIGANVFLMESVPPGSLVVYEETQLKIHAKPGKIRPGTEWSI